MRRPLLRIHTRRQLDARREHDRRVEADLRAQVEARLRAEGRAERAEAQLEATLRAAERLAEHLQGAWWIEAASALTDLEIQVYEHRRGGDDGKGMAVRTLAELCCR